MGGRENAVSETCLPLAAGERKLNVFRLSSVAFIISEDLLVVYFQKLLVYLHKALMFLHGIQSNGVTACCTPWHEGNEEW